MAFTRSAGVRLTMQVVVATLGSAGDVYPFIAIARGLQARGHDVTFLTSSYFEALAHGNGLAFHSIGDTARYERLAAHPDFWEPGKGFRPMLELLVEPALQPVYDFVTNHYRPGETVVVTSTWALGARVAQDKLGVPVVTIHLSPAIFRSAYRAARFAGLSMAAAMPPFVTRVLWRAIDRFVLDPAIAPAVNALRRRVGLAPQTRLLHGWIHSPTRVLALFPEWFAPRQPDWPTQAEFVDFVLCDEEPKPEDAALERFLASGSAPVVFTPGSAMPRGRRFFEIARDACRLIGRRAVFITRYRDQVPANLPATVFHSIPTVLSRLLSRSAALVYHGGIGTCAQALRAGIPQLVVPMAHDQFDNARAVRCLGAGKELHIRALNTRTLTAKLIELLRSATIASRCRDIAGRFQAGDRIERLYSLIEQCAFHPFLARPSDARRSF